MCIHSFIQVVSFPFTHEGRVTPNTFLLLLIVQDCDDSSDEKNCRMVSFDSEKYLKNKPPPPPDGMDKLPVTARYACTSFIHVVQDICIPNYITAWRLW